jgi:hypothetical protein
MAKWKKLKIRPRKNSKRKERKKPAFPKWRKAEYLLVQRPLLELQEYIFLDVGK